MLTNGRKLDNRYLIREEIGSGGFGAVYLAEDTRFTGSNQVAIKKIAQNNEITAKAFRHEANLLYNLSHPNLPKVTNCFQEDEANYIVMSYIAGEDLMARLKKGKRFSIGEVLEISEKVLDALEYLHSFLIFHRDIKPHNIKIDPNGKIYLLDFGTAKGHLDETTLSLTDQSITGYTPFYAPLEQVLRVDANSFLLLQSIDSPNLEKFLLNKTDARSDIYSLGATIYHLLTGFSPERATATVRAHLVWSGKPDPLPDCRSINAEISEQFTSIIAKCLEIDPENRFQTAAELRLALQNRQLFAASDSDNKTIGFAPHPILETQPSPVQAISEQTKRHTAEPAKFTAAPSVVTVFQKNDLPEQKAKVGISLYHGLLALLLGLMIFGGWLAWRGLSGETAKQPITADLRTLSYSLLVQKMRDGKKFQEPFESSGQEIFESGYQFQLRLKPPADGSLYVFGEGLNDKGEKIITINFPTPLKNGGQSDVSVNLKYESGWNEFRGKPGTENYWLIFSRGTPPAAEKARENAFANNGVVTDRETSDNLKNYLESAKNTKVTVSKDVEKKLTRIDFEGGALVYLLGLEHR